MRFLAFLVCVVFCGGPFAPEVSARPDLERVKLRGIDLPETRGSRQLRFQNAPVQVRAIRLRLAKGRVRVTQVRITYVDGTHHTEDRIISLDPADWTREIDPQKEFRTLASVRIDYVRRGDGVPRLEIYAARAPIPAASEIELAEIDKEIRNLEKRLRARKTNDRQRVARTLELARARRQQIFASAITANQANHLGERKSRDPENIIDAYRKAELDRAKRAEHEAAVRRAKEKERRLEAEWRELQEAARQLLKRGSPQDFSTQRSGERDRSNNSSLGRSRAERAAAQRYEQLDAIRKRAEVIMRETQRTKTELKRLGQNEQLLKSVEKSRRSLERSTKSDSSTRTGPKPDVDPQCVTDGTCTAVKIFFGTNRTRTTGTAQTVAFTNVRQNQNAFGRAVVTVPKSTDRAPGKISRPTWWERNIYRVPAAGDPNKHFVIVQNGYRIYSNDDAFIAAVKAHMAEAGRYKDHAVVYVHGYNMSFESALYRTAQIAYDLGLPIAGTDRHQPFGTTFMYAWPSAGQLKDYPHDIENAFRSVDNLRSFLDLVIEKTGAKHVHIIAHSMGNLPLLSALEGMASEERTEPAVSQLIFASPDVNAADFMELAQRIRPVVKHMTLYASSKDLAMEASRKVHADKPRAGDVLNNRPIVVPGVDTIDISAMTTCYWCLGHDEYVEQPTLLNDIAQLFRVPYRKPHERNLSLRPTGQLPSLFWRYRQ